MRRPVIALLTDFGIQNHYVGAMRGTILTICPDATLVDITHDVAPQDVPGAAFELGAAFRYFPPDTIFLAVVDPGVGSARKALAAAAGGYRFVAPDNGLLTRVFREATPALVVEITERRYALPIISRTFEGRDRFAPAAAWLATGVTLTGLGGPVTEWQTLDLPTPTVTERGITGHVVRVDRFGNLVTSFPRDLVDALREGGGFQIAAAGHRIGALVGTYAEAEPGATCALIGSSDDLEIAVIGGSAAARLGIGCGAVVTLTRG